MIKQLFFLILSTFFCLSISAQKQSNSRASLSQKHFQSTTSNVTLGTTAIAGNMVSYGYRASMTQTLDITLNVNNPDLEYVDSLAITFPTGITPISSPNNTFPTINNAGGYCYYNGVIGQTISWGENNNDQYGGVYGSGLNFRVVVNVGAITGVVTATFHLSGDGYLGGGGTADLNGTFQLSPKLPVDFRIIGFSIPYVGCLNTNSEWIGVYARNDGYNSATGTTTLSYQINTSAAVAETTTLTITPNDTLSYVFNVSGDFAAFTTYTVNGLIANSLDGNSTNNGSTRYTETFPKNTIPYQTSFETAPTLDLLNWYGRDFDSPNYWDTTDIAPRSGRLCFRMLENTATSCEDWLFSPCLDLQATKNYQLSYWTRLTSGYVGSFGSFLLSAQNTDSIKQVFRSPNNLIANSTWAKDSVTFNVPMDGVYHIGFVALNYTQEIIAMRLDDILIKETGILTGIGNLELDEISVYPNPTKDELTIYTPNSNLTIELFNQVGQLILSTKTKQLGSNKLSTSELAAGVYLLKLSSDRNIFYKKIIKQ